VHYVTNSSHIMLPIVGLAIYSMLLIITIIYLNFKENEFKLLWRLSGLWMSPRYFIAIQIWKCFLKCINSWYTASLYFHFFPSIWQMRKFLKYLFCNTPHSWRYILFYPWPTYCSLSCHVPSVARRSACAHFLFSPTGQNDADDRSPFPRSSECCNRISVSSYTFKPFTGT
jgi:hypothetical protein